MSARILVVEDSPDSLELLGYLLRMFGHEPILAASGAEGVRLAIEERPDLILMDIQMPGMDGYEACSLIRSEGDRPSTPVVALTASVMVGDAERIIASGFDAYMSKPIAPERFADQIEAVLAHEPHADVIFARMPSGDAAPIVTNTGEGDIR